MSTAVIAIPGSPPANPGGASIPRRPTTTIPSPRRRKTKIQPSCTNASPPKTTLAYHPPSLPPPNPIQRTNKTNIPPANLAISSAETEGFTLQTWHNFIAATKKHYCGQRNKPFHAPRRAREGRETRTTGREREHHSTAAPCTPPPSLPPFLPPRRKRSLLHLPSLPLAMPGCHEFNISTSCGAWRPPRGSRRRRRLLARPRRRRQSPPAWQR